MAIRIEEVRQWVFNTIDEMSAIDLSPAAPNDVRTFEEVGIKADDDGILLIMMDGSEYQLTIKKVKEGR